MNKPRKKHHEVASVRGPSPRPEKPHTFEVRLVLSVPGLSSSEVVDYVRDAVKSHSGQFDGDDARRGIRVLKICKLAWVDITNNDEKEKVLWEF